MKRSHLAREIIETIALTLLIFGVIRFAVQNYLVDGISMQPGLNSNEYVLVNKMAYTFHGPDAFEEVFELAEPGKAFEVYSRSRFTRAK